MWFCVRKTAKELKKKKVILEYAISFVKFPLHLYSPVAIKAQFPVSEKRLQSTLCYQMLPRRSGMLQMVLLLPGSPCPWAQAPAGRREPPAARSRGAGTARASLAPGRVREVHVSARLRRESRRNKSRSPLAGVHTTALSAASELALERWSAWERGTCSWHRAPLLGFSGMSPASPSATENQ